MSCATKRAPRHVEPEIPQIQSPIHEVGDWVWVLYWQPFQVGYQDKGQWNTSLVRVVSAGRMVCCDLAGSAMPPTTDNEGGTPGGSLYYAKPENVFADREAANSDAQTRTPPKVSDPAAGMTWPT